MEHNKGGGAVMHVALHCNMQYRITHAQCVDINVGIGIGIRYNKY